MRLHKSQSKNSCTYYAIETTRKSNGTKTTKIYERIGSKQELLDKGITDPEEYAKKRVEEINKSLESDVMDVNLKIDFSDSLISQSVETENTSMNIGWAYIKELYKKLGLHEFKWSDDSKAKYDASGIALSLSASRMLWPCSKKATLKQNSNLIGGVDYSLHDAYRFLSVINEKAEELQKHLYNSTKKIIKLQEKVLYYDCTNFYFETETEDENTYSDNGDILQWGFRRYGVSKEHRPNPIVQMGLFTDENGIPISYCLHHGSNNEQNTAIPLEERMAKEYSQSKFIYCSDGGLGSIKIRAYNSIFDRNYIVTQSLKKIEEDELALILKDANWKFLDDNSDISLEKFKAIADKRLNGENLTPEEEAILSKDIIYKRFPMKRKIELSLLNPKMQGQADIDENIHVTFSARYYCYQRTIFSKQVDRAKNMIDKNISKKKGPNDITRFIEETAVTSSGEVADEKISEMNTKTIDKEMKFHGFYAVATSLDDSTKEILRINSQRWKIEQSFRIMKTEFESRPVYVSTKEHICAHFATCYIALVLYRILESQLDSVGKHFTPSQILNTLRNMQVIQKDGYYEAIYTGSEVLDALEKVYNLKLNKKYYRKKTLDELFKN